jgi:hypothetical protein
MYNENNWATLRNHTSSTHDICVPLFRCNDEVQFSLLFLFFEVNLIPGAVLLKISDSKLPRCLRAVL